MNTITLSGNLTKEPESRSAGNSEFSVISFSIANNDERRKTSDGSYENVASFIDCEYWTKNPQYWLQQLYKGTPVVIVGAIKQDRWNDKQSNEARSKIKIRLTEFPIVASRKNEVAPPAEPTGEPAPKTQAPPSRTAPKPAPPIPPEQFDDDIPF